MDIQEDLSLEIALEVVKKMGLHTSSYEQAKNILVKLFEVFKKTLR